LGYASADEDLSGLLFVSALAVAQVTIKTTTILDGKGRTLKNQTITVDGAKITRLANNGRQTRLRSLGLTVLPGWIDTHVHLTWHFDRNNASHPTPKSHRRQPPSRPQSTHGEPCKAASLRSKASALRWIATCATPSIACCCPARG